MEERLAHTILLLFLLSSCTLLASSESITFKCEDGWDLIGTHCYYFVNVPLDFEDAKDVCESYGAALLTVRDEVESKNVSGQDKVTAFSEDHYWIYNGKDLDYDDDSSTSPNDSFCEGMWQPDEPMATDEQVAVASNKQGRWALRPIWTNLPFVCRTPACPTVSFRCNDGTCINENWKCDGASDCRDSSDEIGCQDCFEHYKASSGTFMTTGDQTYCMWIIEGQPGQILRLKFGTLKIEDNVDHLMVYTGGPTVMTSELLVDVRESFTDSFTLFSRNHFLIVTLQSEATDFEADIRAEWTSDDSLSQGRMETVTVSSVETLISSPYSNQQPELIPKFIQKEWSLSAPEGELITIQILNNTFDSGNDSEDTFMITNVGFKLEETLTNKNVYISNGNTMSVILKTSQKGRYFNAVVRQGCDFSTTVTKASYRLLDLPAEVDCLWKFENGLGTVFNVKVDEAFFDDFEDHLQVINGTSDVADIVYTANRTNSDPANIFHLVDGVTFSYHSNLVRPSNKMKGLITAECPSIPNQNNMMVQYDEMREAGMIYHVNISCEEGFSFRQEEYSGSQMLTAVCKEGGQWSWGNPSFTRFPECQVVYCGLPPLISNGVVDNIGGNVTYRGVAKYKCNIGFTVTQPDYVTCEANGEWSSRPECQAENCDSPPSILNGYWSVSSGDDTNLSQGTVVEYTCDCGYELVGSKRIVCETNKTWSDIAPQCNAMSCSLPAIDNGNYRPTVPSSDLPKFGDPVTLSCDNGYEVNRTNTGTAETQCGCNRTLETDDDICVDINECDRGNSTCNGMSEMCENTNGSFKCVCNKGFTRVNNTGPCQDIDECELDLCDQQCSNSDGSYSCSCDEGFDLYLSNGTNGLFIPKEETGVLDGDVYHINHTCVPTTCSGLPDAPANSTLLASKSQYVYNDTIQIVCEYGFKLVGSTFAVCGSNGNWSFEVEPQCEKLTCDQPPNGMREVMRMPGTNNPIEPGGSLVITCRVDDGSGSTINRTMYCAPNPGNFSEFILQGDNPSCPDVSCGPPLEIPGANHGNVSDWTYGSSFEFQCDSAKGFNQTGSSTLGNNTVVCEGTGRWGYGNLTCEGSRCGDPGTRDGTNQIVETSFEIGQVVRYNCTQPGFTPQPNDTLECLFENGGVKWSGEPPVCIDTTAPEIICPTLEPFDLYETLVYDSPIASDNSNFTCVKLENGPPSGVSVVSNYTVVAYRVTDLNNQDARCHFNVTLKDQKVPELECPPTIRKDLGSNRSASLNTKDLLLKFSDDGDLSFDPEGPLTINVGQRIPVRAKLLKENGLFKECAFLVEAFSSECMNGTLTPPENGELQSCNGNAESMSCTFVCNEGYLLQTKASNMTATCVNGTWQETLPLRPCLDLASVTFDYEVEISYKLNGSKFLVNFDYTNCPISYAEKLADRVANMTACNYKNFTAVGIGSNEQSGSIEDADFTLKVETDEGNVTVLEQCAQTIKNLRQTLFGPISPITNTPGLSCLSPWNVDVSKTSIVNAKDFSCKENAELIDMGGTRSCLPCGPGTSYNPVSKMCDECGDGFYQDEAAQTMCKPCNDSVTKSYPPRSSRSHCYERCQSGFISTTGYVDEECVVCPEDFYSLNSSHCEPCPYGGSTKGVSGAVSEEECQDPCPVGHYSLSGFKPCWPCPHNFYSDMTKSKTCTECPEDSYTFANGSTSLTDCQNDETLPCTDFCSENGTVGNDCKIQSHRPVCTCKPGFHGDSCSMRCDVCNPNPCYNGGECKADGQNFTCLCQSDSVCDFEKIDNLRFSSDRAIVTIIPMSKLSLEECQENCTQYTSCLAYMLESENGQAFCLMHKILFYDAVPNNRTSYIKNCSFQPLFSGDRCEVDLIDDCSDSTCVSRDFCVDLVGGAKCQCPPGENYNDRCEKPADLCSPSNNKCENGVCVPYGSVRSVCECNPGYTGDRCDTNIDDCADNPLGCLFNGACVDGVDKYDCQCLDGFSGDHCEMKADFCESNSCAEDAGGICTNNYETFMASCTCGEHHHIDAVCDFEKIDNLKFSSDPAVVTIKLMSTPFREECEENCAQDTKCQAYMLELDSNNGQAYCLMHKTVFYDLVPNNFTSYLKNCSVQPYMMETDTCHPVDYCDDSPCVNGTCMAGSAQGEYSCVCDKGFEGFLCQHNVDDCASSPCQNDARCVDGVDGFSCECLDGYTGTNCSSVIDFCDCVDENSEGCDPLVGDFLCHCKTGYTGKNCSENIDECEVFEPCLHGGTCNDTVGDYECTCLLGWTGKNCESEQPYCESDPCDNGDCFNLRNQYYCQCDNGTSGVNCSEVDNLCEKFGDFICAKEGECVLEGGSAKCSCIGEEVNCILVEDTEKNVAFRSTGPTLIGRPVSVSREECESLCRNNKECQALVQDGGFCLLYRSVETTGGGLYDLAMIKTCTSDPYYSGSSCQLQKNHCADDVCNGGMCKLSNLTYTCDCMNLKNSEGRTCNESLNVCEQCPQQNAECKEYIDQEGNAQAACLCKANEVAAGDACKVVNKDFDLAFLEEFASTNSWVTSERAFYLGNDTNLAVAFWIAAARPLDNDNFILRLMSTQNNTNPILTIYNNRVQFGTTDSRSLNSTLDEDTKWHFISVTWPENGDDQIIIDFTTNSPNAHLRSSPPKDTVVFVQLGQGFYGYMSQVSVWNSVLSTDESLDIYEDSQLIPQPENLLLGWTQYSYNVLVQRTSVSNVEQTKSVCDIPNTIAECEATDKTLPEIPNCNATVTFVTDYSKHFIGTTELSNECGVSPTTNRSDSEYYTFGAHDMARSVWNEQNVAVCRTRIYVTPNQCETTAPSANVSQECPDNQDGRSVCPGNQLPSVPTPRFIMCGHLRSYNLDNMYEKPDRTVCGDIKARTRTVNMTLVYTIGIACNSDVEDDIANAMEAKIRGLGTKWPELQSINVSVDSDCTNREAKTNIVINGLSETLVPTSNMTLELTPEELMKKSVKDRDPFNINNIANAQLQADRAVISSTASCPTGYGIRGTNCVQCGPGTYYDANEKMCKLCELNQYTDQPGKTVCSTCDVGKVTLQRGSSSVADCKPKCKVGHMLNGSQVCEPCPKNFYQDQEGKDYCLPCMPLSGTEKTGSVQAEDCIDFCPPGTELKSGICTPCERGYFRIGNAQDPCTQCPANFTTAMEGSDCTGDCVIPICPPGQKVLMPDKVCELCPVGTYQPEEAQFECEPCDENYTTEKEGTHNASQCLFICPEGHEEFPPDSKQCRPCLRGFYRSNDTDQRFENCSMCQSGKTTVGNGSISDTECDIPICPAGERVLMPQKTCERCPVGTYQPEEAQFNCSACNENYTTENDGTHNASQCLFICPVGHEEFPPDSKQCRPCLRGFYRSNDTDQRFENCSICPDDFTTEGIGSISEADCDIPICSIGTYLNMTTKKCVPCPLNTYQDEILKQECKPCPSGYKTEQEMSTNITDCKFVCPAGQQAIGGICLLCPRGTYKDESMMFDMCQNCTGGNTTDNEGAVSVALCNVARCTMGFKVSDDNSTCVPCPYDTYQDVDLPYSTTQCQPCPRGRGTEHENSTSVADCKVVCEPGFGITNGNCLPCENGTWNDGQLPHRFMECQPCPENFTTPANMATSKDNCTLPDCKPGSRIDGMTCTPCEKGFYQPDSLKDSCIQCEQNKSTSNIGSVSSTECSVYCPAGQEELGTTGQCVPCQNDHYKPAPDFGSCSACTGDFTSTPNNRTSCTEQFCDLGRELRNGACENCKVGYYKSERGNTGCSQCPANHITPSEGSKSNDSCTVIYCDPGLYLNNSSTCTACPMGSYKNDSGNQSCTECPAGVTTPGKGSTRSEDCYVVSCAVGQFRHNATLCLPCPIGQYQNKTDQDACKQCQNVNGYETTTSSASSTKETDCLPLCPKGKFLQISDRSCQNCPVGTYKTTTNLDTECRPCPSNYTTSSVGSTTAADCRYQLCKKGTYREGNNINCTLCPYGTYQDSDNNPNVAACTPCPAGNTTLIKGATDGNHYCVAQCGSGSEYILGIKACQKCSVGQYTPAKSEAMEPTKCRYCPQGQTTTASGQSGISSCVTTSTTPAPPVKFSVTVSVRVTVASCENPGGVIATLMTILRQLLSIQRGFYQGLCPTADCSTNVNIDIQNLCANQKRRKRAAVMDTEVLVTVSDIDSILQDNSIDMIRRPSLPVIEEAFYNQSDAYIQNLMDQWDITLIEFGTTAPQISCPDGYYSNPASSACEKCKAGEAYDETNQNCTLCAKGTYSIGVRCISCSDGETTQSEGSVFAEDCDGICRFETSYCGDHGDCEVDGNGKSSCVCDSKYKGPSCTQRVTDDDDRIPLVVGVSVGVAVFLLMVLLIIGVCAYSKRHNSNSKKSLSSDTEFVDNNYKYPVFNPGMMWANDPTMYNGEVLELYNGAATPRTNGYSSSDTAWRDHSRSRRSDRRRDWD